MAIKYMTSVHISDYEGTNISLKGWEYQDVLSTASNGDTVIIPENIKNISATLEITSGSGKIQTTTSLLNDVINNPGSVVWVDWDMGVISTTEQDSCLPVTAIRQVNVSGTTKMILRAQ